MRTRLPLLAALVAACLTTACGDDGDDGVAPPSMPEALRIEPGSLDLRIGQNAGLSYALLDGAGQPVGMPAGWAAAWTSSDTSVATVASDGTVLGRRIGTATVGLSAGALSDQALVTVLAPATTKDAASAAGATLDAAGGTITTTAADGTRYALAVPPGALGAPVEIRLTPLVGVANLPLSGGLAAGLEFSPDGLVFRLPAVLTVLATGPVDPAGLVGFELSNGGFRLSPVKVRSDTLTLLVGHFSDAGIADGDAAEIDALAGIPAPYPEDEAMQDLAAVIATAAETGTAPDAARLEQIFLDWYVAAVEPGLNEAVTDPDGLEDAIGEFARWESAIALWADGLMQDQIEAGREAAAQALGAQVERLNQKCATENDWSPVAEMLDWVSVAELMGVATADNGLQVDQVIANLCVQVQILEAELPETIGATETIELGLKAGLSVGGRAPVFDPALDIVASGGTSALVSPPSGATDGEGRFTADVSLQDEATRARVDVEARFPELPAVSATRTLTSEGRVTLELGGRPGGTNAPLAGQVDIEPGEQAHLVVTLLKGRGGHAGNEVVLELAGPGSLNESAVAVDSEGTRSVWYTAPESGQGEAWVTAKFLSDGELLTAEVLIRFIGFDPVDLELDFGTEEPDPTVAGPVLQAGVDYVIHVSGTYSIWSSEWQNGACKGSPGSGVGGQTGLDAEAWFAIPKGSTLCGGSFECCPNHTGKFRMSLDGGADFDHIHPEGGEQYNASHEYTYRVTGQGKEIHFMLEESSARGDDYGVLSIRIERSSGTSAPGTDNGGGG